MSDKDFFCEQIRLYESAMYSLAYSVVKNESDAMEILSETIFRAYKNFESLKNTSAFKSWILKIVHNTSVEYIRKNSKIIPLDEIESENINQSENIINTISVKTAIESLKQPYRTVTTLYYYNDLTVSEIAVITNSTSVAVKQQLARARKQLKEILKEDFSNE